MPYVYIDLHLSSSSIDDGGIEPLAHRLRRLCRGAGCCGCGLTATFEWYMF
jgi:hypothetical protein